MQSSVKEPSADPLDELETLRHQLKAEQQRVEHLLAAGSKMESELVRLREEVKRLSTSAPSSGPPTPGTLPSRPGTGKAPPPPPPTGKSAPPPLSKSAPPTKSFLRPKDTHSNPEVAKANDLVNVHWRSGSGTLPEDDADPFLRPLMNFAQENGIAKLASFASSPSVFSRPVTFPIPSSQAIAQYFTKKQSKSVPTLESGTRNKTSNSSALDTEKQKLVGLAIGGTLGKRKFSFKQYADAIESCDFALLSPAVAVPLLQLLNSVTDEEMAAVKSNVSKSDAPLPDCDSFIFEMASVPKVRERLECIIFIQSFPDIFGQAEANVALLREALGIISKRSEKLARLFQLAVWIGNELNAGSRAQPVTSFAASHFARLSEVKATLDPRVSLLHFAVSCVAPASDEEAALFSDSEITTLKQAAAVRAHRVRDEAKDLLDSVNAIMSTMNFSGKFGQVMSTFISDTKARVAGFAAEAAEVFKRYKSTGNFFEDCKSVYPPPKEKSEGVDLFEWSMTVATAVRVAEKETRKWGLKSECCGPDTLATRTSEISESSSSMRSSSSVSPFVFSSIPLSGPPSAPPSLSGRSSEIGRIVAEQIGVMDDGSGRAMVTAYRRPVPVVRGCNASVGGVSESSSSFGVRNVQRSIVPLTVKRRQSLHEDPVQAELRKFLQEPDHVGPTRSPTHSSPVALETPPGGFRDLPEPRLVSRSSTPTEARGITTRRATFRFDSSVKRSSVAEIDRSTPSLNDRRSSFAARHSLSNTVTKISRKMLGVEITADHSESSRDASLPLRDANSVRQSLGSSKRSSIDSLPDSRVPRQPSIGGRLSLSQAVARAHQSRQREQMIDVIIRTPTSAQGAELPWRRKTAENDSG